MSLLAIQISMQKDTTPTYQLFSPLHLRDPDQAIQLVQVLKALCEMKAPPLSIVA